MKMLMVANRRFYYGTRRIRAGDQFFVPLREVDVWTKLGYADFVPQLEEAETAAMLAPYVPPATDPVPMAPPAAPVPDLGPLPPVIDAPAPENAGPGNASPEYSLDGLRAQYEEITGQKADKRWGLNRLLDAINAERP